MPSLPSKVYSRAERWNPHRRESEPWIAAACRGRLPQGLDLVRKGPVEMGDREGLGEAEAEGGSMLGPPGCGLELSTWVQRASPVRMGGLYIVKCYPYVSVFSLSVLLYTWKPCW